MLSNYGRAATMPMKRIVGTRSLAQVTNAKVEPFLLEEMADYKNGKEENLPPFVISRQRGFLPRKVNYADERELQKEQLLTCAPLISPFNSYRTR